MAKTKNIKRKNTSLVYGYGQNVETTSLIIADKFRKRHDNVVQKIENIINLDESNRLIFKVVEYVDLKGEERKMYKMDRDSFSMLAMSFTGKKAFRWKLDFIHAFNLMEKELLIIYANQQNPQHQQARLEGKEQRKELTDAIQRVVDLAEQQGSRNAGKYYYLFTALIYKKLFNYKAKQELRCFLNVEQLKRLELVECYVSNWINDSIKNTGDYHKPYNAVKKKLKKYLKLIGWNRVQELINEKSTR